MNEVSWWAPTIDLLWIKSGVVLEAHYPRGNPILHGYGHGTLRPPVEIAPPS